MHRDDYGLETCNCYREAVPESSLYHIVKTIRKYQKDCLEQRPVASVISLSVYCLFRPYILIQLIDFTRDSRF